MLSRNSLLRLVISLGFASLLILHCSQEPGSAESHIADEGGIDHLANEMMDDETQSTEAAQPTNTAEQERPRNQNRVSNQPNAFLPAERAGSDRLLEYQLRFVYRTDEFSRSRLQLLNIIGRYGFLASQNTAHTGRATMNSEFRVASEDLLDAIRAMEELGVLQEESVQVVDHTEDMVRADRQAWRESIRIKRRINNVNASTSQNRAELERLLEASENREDEAAHQRWQIRDRVKWATVSLTLLGPELPPRVEVPPYTHILTGLANLFLWILYGLLWVIPIAAPFALLGWWIWRRFRKKA